MSRILDAIAALERLTLAEIKDADDVLLGKLFHGTQNWNMLAESERLRRRDAAMKLPMQAQERP